jgi:hypothetical protein
MAAARISEALFGSDLTIEHSGEGVRRGNAAAD